MSSGQADALKYLTVMPDRLGYHAIELRKEEVPQLEELWSKIYEEYNSKEKNMGAQHFINDRSKILYFYAVYTQEQAMLKSLLYRTNPMHIRVLRSKGYELSATSQAAYWQSLRNALNKVKSHLTHIEILKSRHKEFSTDTKKEGNPYDAIMAWIAANNIYVEENITVTRYLEIKHIIEQRIKAKQREHQKSKLHG